MTTSPSAGGVTVTETLFTEYVTEGDTIVDKRGETERRYTFRYVSDDGYVYFEDAFGGTGCTLADVWQMHFEKGDYKLIPNEATE